VRTGPAAGPDLDGFVESLEAGPEPAVVPVDEGVVRWPGRSVVGGLPGDHEGGEFFDGDGVLCPAGRDLVAAAVEPVTLDEPRDPVGEFGQECLGLGGVEVAPGPAARRVRRRRGVR
jgi:hypothetical protein